MLLDLSTDLLLFVKVLRKGPFGDVDGIGVLVALVCLRLLEDGLTTIVSNRLSVIV